MEAWGWILVYLVGFTLFQLLLFRYFTNDADGASLGTGDVSTPQSVEQGQPVRDDGERSDSDRDGDFCQHCGAFNENEQKFRYCRECLSELR
jgi:hypothetical protein